MVCNKSSLSILCLCLVAELGSYSIIGKPCAFKMIIAVTVTIGLLLPSPSARLEATQGMCRRGLESGQLTAPLAHALRFIQYPHLVALVTEVDCTLAVGQLGLGGFGGLFPVPAD